MNLENKIEAILFFKGEPVSLKKLGDIVKVSPGEVLAGISNLKTNLDKRVIALLENNSDFNLGTAPEFSQHIEY